MIYITQLVFLKPGREVEFLEFENHAIPLMEKHGGVMLYRIRPKNGAFISNHGKLPYEVHFISFESDQKLVDFMNDENRLKFIHLKNESIESTVIIKGEQL